MTDHRRVDVLFSERMLQWQDRVALHSFADLS